MFKITLKNPKIALFDLDGTLVDTIELFAQSLGHIVKREFNVPYAIGHKVIWDTAGKTPPEQMQIAVELAGKNWKNLSAGKNIDALVKEFFHWVTQQNIKALPYAKQTLQKLRKRGFKIVVTTNSPPNTAKAKLKDAGLLPLIDLTIGRKKGIQEKGKQHFAILRKAFSVKGKNAFHVVYIGDGKEDMRLAKLNNARRIGITNVFKMHELKKAGAEKNYLKT
jgi:phosphoglycolate phosphatase